MSATTITRLAPFVFTGGCLCKNISYRCDAEPILMGNCHCTACRKTTGSGYAPIVEVPVESLVITGNPQWYEVETDRGSRAARAFCPTCGSTIFGRIFDLPDVAIVMAGTLDDSSWFFPTLNVWTVNAPAWDIMHPDVPRLDTQPAS